MREEFNKNCPKNWTLNCKKNDYRIRHMAGCCVCHQIGDEHPFEMLFNCRRTRPESEERFWKANRGKGKNKMNHFLDLGPRFAWDRQWNAINSRFGGKMTIPASFWQKFYAKFTLRGRKEGGENVFHATIKADTF